MRYSTAMPRRALWKAASALGAAAAASLTLVASAGAAPTQIITVQGDSGTSNNLDAAIQQANGLTGTGPIIMVLSPGRYKPANVLTPIVKSMTITSNHALQAPFGGPASTIIDGTTAFGASTASGKDEMVIQSGAKVEMDGIEFESMGNPNGNAISVLGSGSSLTLNNSVIASGNSGSLSQLNIGAGASARLTNSSVANFPGSSAVAAINNGGTLTLTSVDMLDGTNAAINNMGTATVNNSFIADSNNTAECIGTNAAAINGGVTTIVDDSSCGPNISNPNDLSYGPTLPFVFNGGPTATDLKPLGSTASGTGSPTFCGATDQRFFPNPVVGGTRHCDIGATTNGNTQRTALPGCTVTATRPAGTGPAQQDVTVTDPSGLGPQAGDPGGTDPQAAGAINPAAAITNLAITNGSVAINDPVAPNPFTFATNPFPTSLVLTATKGSDPTVGTTHWHFTATAWDGVTKNCS